ncbi:uncharacterized protein PADG_06557 [Paracoccidioides brasiliensis Pb18]|uniref:Glycoprotein X n=1 Tax=Paracoccidioides brasiliensis (strain Pb18) TaxID=502780 RepID=C1GH21_PARBD|nr:uncharacterized protein PADG_06557 [Paracoccidioides brasiliensis Pb18]EEH50478.1 hypothetical protein PADG_06557 [Paracoccidioides brasiliensis Pb18]
MWSLLPALICTSVCIIPANAQDGYVGPSGGLDGEEPDSPASATVAPTITQLPRPDQPYGGYNFAPPHSYPQRPPVTVTVTDICSYPEQPPTTLTVTDNCSYPEQPPITYTVTDVSSYPERPPITLTIPGNCSYPEQPPVTVTVTDISSYLERPPITLTIPDNCTYPKQPPITLTVPDISSCPERPQVTITVTDTVTQNRTERLTISYIDTITISNTVIVTDEQTVTVTDEETITIPSTLTVTDEQIVTVTDEETITIPSTLTVTDERTVTITDEDTITIPSTLTVTDEKTVTITDEETITVPTTEISVTTLPGSTITTVTILPGAASTITTYLPASIITLSRSTITLPGSTIVTTTTAPGRTVTATITHPPIVTTFTYTGPRRDATATVTNSVTKHVTPCPSLTVNPTFTPSVPYPSNYLWGCPPGTLCKPDRRKEKGRCNVEVGFPSLEYFCRPEECEPNPRLIPQWWGKPAVSREIGEWVVSDHYYNLDPRKFGLGLDIFVFKNSTPKDQYPTRPALARRQVINVPLPSPCFDDCNNAAQECSKGKEPRILCVAGSRFFEYLGYCRKCVEELSMNLISESVEQTFPVFSDALNFCEDQPGNDIPPVPDRSPSASPSTPKQNPTRAVPSETIENLPVSWTTQMGSSYDGMSHTSPPPRLPLRPTSTPTDTIYTRDQPPVAGSGPTRGTPSQSSPVEFPGIANVISIPDTKNTLMAIAGLAIILAYL